MLKFILGLVHLKIKNINYQGKETCAMCDSNEKLQ